MQLKEIEQTLQAMLEAERAVEKKQRWQMPQLFRWRAAGAEKKTAKIAMPGSTANEKQRWQLPQLFRQGAAAGSAEKSTAKIAAPDAAIKESPRWQLPQLLRRPAVAIAQGKAKSSRRSDFVVAGLGVSLGLVCAMFPWYIFFNPEKFGIQALRFEGNGQGGKFHTLALNAHFLRLDDFLAEDPQKSDKVDPFTTSTLPDAQEKPASAGDQPFPAEDIPYRLVHVVNGRALIEDDAGLWVVQPGSLLPDSSHVASIEQRAGKWVLLTNKDKVVALTQ